MAELEEFRQVLNTIAAKDRFIGIYSEQIFDGFQNSNFVLSFIGTCALMEHCTKFSADMIDGRFHDALTEIHNKGLITDEEHDIVSNLKQNRNKLFHENIHSGSFFIDGISYPVNENETFELLLKNNLLIYLKIIEKIC